MPENTTMVPDQIIEGDLPADDGDSGGDAARADLPPAARRALREAEERRKAAALEARDASAQSRREIAGRGGLDPVRYGDWEIKGILSDF